MVYSDSITTVHMLLCELDTLYKKAHKATSQARLNMKMLGTNVKNYIVVNYEIYVGQWHFL